MHREKRPWVEVRLESLTLIFLLSLQAATLRRILSLRRNWDLVFINSPRRTMVLLAFLTPRKKTIHITRRGREENKRPISWRRQWLEEKLVFIQLTTIIFLSL